MKNISTSTKILQETFQKNVSKFKKKQYDESELTYFAKNKCTFHINTIEYKTYEHRTKLLRLMC